LIHPPIVKSGAWGYFNRASQGQQAEYAAGGILYLSDSRIFKFKAVNGAGSNNYDKLKPTEFLLRVAVEER
jgi:hypothetical protein